MIDILLPGKNTASRSLTGYCRGSTGYLKHMAGDRTAKNLTMSSINTSTLTNTPQAAVNPNMKCELVPLLGKAAILENIPSELGDCSLYGLDVKFWN